MQRRVEQSDRDRQAGHDLEQIGEVLPLHRQQFGERGAPAFFGLREDHLAHRDDALALEEHVLGAAQADAFGAEAARGARVERRLGVGAHLHPAHPVGPCHQRRELAGHLRLDHRHRADQHLAGRAVDGDDVALLQGDAAGLHRLRRVVDADRAGAGDAGLAHAARDDRRVRSHAAAGRQDALGGVHAVNVLGRGLDAHQQHLVAGRLKRLGLVGGEDDLAARRAGRSRQARGEGLALDARVDRRVQQLVEGRRLDAGDRLFLGQQALVGHLDRDAQRGARGALAVAGLQHPQLAALDGELHVLKVAVVLLEQLRRRDELLEHRRHHRLERRLVGAGRLARLLGDVLRRANAGDDVLALRVDQELAVKLVLAGRRVAGEGDAGGARLAHVAEHHRLNVDRGAPVGGNVVEPAVGDRARVHPRAEHRADRAPQLVARVLRERLADRLLHGGLVGDDDLAPVGGGEVGVEVAGPSCPSGPRGFPRTRCDRTRARRSNTSG